MTVAYVDASALTKLVLEELGSDAMHRWYVETERVLCSRVGVVETRRAAGRAQHEPEHLDVILRSVEVVELDDAIARRAATIGPPALRTLDAIHLATALLLGSEVDALVTYDDRLAHAARTAGIPVVRPA